MNIQYKYVGKDLLQIPILIDEAPTVFFYKIFGFCNEKPEEPPTTYHLVMGFQKQKKPSLVKMNQRYSGVCTGNYKINAKINKRPPNSPTVDENQVTMSFRGMKKSCFKCFGIRRKARVLIRRKKPHWGKLFLKEKVWNRP
jgi:hypothetical protein